MRIVKCKFGQRARFEKIPGFVYCGREWGGFEASPLGNPFSTKKDGSLAEVLRKYRRWLWDSLREPQSPVLLALASLTEDSVLGCWCVEKEKAGEGREQCHADVIVKAWRYLQSQKGH